MARPLPGILTWLSSVEDNPLIGLVRAQGPTGVAWVGLVGAEAPSVGPQPRQTQVGASIQLPSLPGASYRVSDPFGTLLQGNLQTSAQFRLIQPGEWLFEIRQDGKLVALFPIYAGIEAPTEPVIGESYLGVLNTETSTRLSRELR